VLDLIDDDSTSWENEPLARLIEQDQLAVYRHRGYWQNMDTLRTRPSCRPSGTAASHPGAFE